ncbi:MAG: aminotransferase class I/II-fold pyridoxal phosphate-dependent enzyme [Armatimonadota bacterium]
MDYNPLDISPFTAKDQLVAEACRVLGSQADLLDASRGGPNWQQRTVSSAWYTLGLYADYYYGALNTEGSVRMMPSVDHVDHSAAFERFTDAVIDSREVLAVGTRYLHAVWDYLSSGIIGDVSREEVIGQFTRAMTAYAYPTPATLEFIQPVANRYLAYMLGRALAAEDFRVHLANGCTDAFRQVVHTMACNELLRPGDRVALVQPWYEPMRDLFSRQYGCEVTGIRRTMEPECHTPHSELQKLDDPELKIVVIVSPGNPVDKTTDEALLDRLQQAVENNPDLVILCDYVYANFVSRQYDNALKRMPKNVVPFYAVSKDFGFAGARVGAVWVHEQSCLQNMLNEQADEVAQRVDEKYASRYIEDRPDFYSRLVMQSAGVSFSHMAGISVANQILFALCALHPLVNPDEASDYFGWLHSELQKRMAALYEGLGLPKQASCDVCESNYCALVPLEELAISQGPRVAREFEKVSLWNFLKHLAHSRGTIVMPAPVFGAEHKTVRICLTSLGTSQYREVGRNIAETIGDYTFPGPCDHCDQ